MMVDPLMEAMTQSGIIDGNVTEDNPLNNLKKSTLVLPKRFLEASRSGHSSWFRVKSEIPSKRLRVERMNEGPVKTSGSQIKPADYELRAPVLRHILAGTFYTATAFNLQVGPESELRFLTFSQKKNNKTLS